MKALFALISVLVLSGCASGFDSASQRVQFDLVNMQKARCEVYNHNGLVKTRAYVLHLPGTYNVERSLEDLHIDCLGLQGLEVSMVVPSQLNETANRNAVNFGVGVIADAASQALFKYPEVITVDFTPVILKQRQQADGEPVSVTSYMAPSPSGSSSGATTDMSGLDAPLCDNNDNKIRCAHKTYNPSVNID